MKILIENISKLATKECIIRIFEVFGIICSIEFKKDMLKRDGTYICQILYSNISSSLLALELSPTELGDRFFEVKRVDDFNSSLPFMDRDPRDRLKKDIQDCKTAVIKLYSSEIEWNSKTNCLLTLKRAKENIINVCGGSDMVVLVELLHSDTKKEDVNVALVEFVGVEEMNRAREMVLSSPTKMKFDEAFRWL